MPPPINSSIAVQGLTIYIDRRLPSQTPFSSSVQQLPLLSIPASIRIELTIDRTDVPLFDTYLRRRKMLIAGTLPPPSISNPLFFLRKGPISKLGSQRYELILAVMQDSRFFSLATKYAPGFGLLLAAINYQHRKNTFTQTPSTRRFISSDSHWRRESRWSNYRAMTVQLYKSVFVWWRQNFDNLIKKYTEDLPRAVKEDIESRIAKTTQEKVVSSVGSSISPIHDEKYLQTIKLEKFMQIMNKYSPPRSWMSPLPQLPLPSPSLAPQPMSQSSSGVFGKMKRFFSSPEPIPTRIPDQMRLNLEATWTNVVMDKSVGGISQPPYQIVWNLELLRYMELSLEDNSNIPAEMPFHFSENGRLMVDDLPGLQLTSDADISMKQTVRVANYNFNIDENLQDWTENKILLKIICDLTTMFFLFKDLNQGLLGIKQMLMPKSSLLVPWEDPIPTSSTMNALR